MEIRVYCICMPLRTLNLKISCFKINICIKTILFKFVPIQIHKMEKYIVLINNLSTKFKLSIFFSIIFHFSTIATINGLVALGHIKPICTYIYFVGVEKWYAYRQFMNSSCFF